MGFSDVRAQSVLASLNDSPPWYSVAEYMEAMCALVTLFHHELQRPTTRGVSLQEVLLGYVSPDTVQWLFNNLRLRRGAPRRMLALLGSGLHNVSTSHGPLTKWTEEREFPFWSLDKWLALTPLLVQLKHRVKL